MCFSAGASFSAAAFLAAIGFLSIKHAPKRLKFFAAIPLLFAIQQFSEGLLWILMTGLPNDSKSPLSVPIIILAAPFGLLSKALSLKQYIAQIKEFTAFVFMFFALVVWPSWMPFSLAFAEERKTRRHFLYAFVALGFGISTILLMGMLSQGVGVRVIAGHMVYTTPEIFTDVEFNNLLLYCMATVVPFFISSLRGTKVLGVLIILSAALAWYAWYTAFGSVWCFFAAVISVMVHSIIHKPRHDHELL